jgi:adenine-specific DNA methylase
MNFIVNESQQKLRGGYYTPLDLATYIARWIQEKHPKAILEPSCGDGIFAQALGEVGFRGDLSFTGFEILKEEAAKAASKCRGIPGLSSVIHAEDFLGWAIKQITVGHSPYDVAVGNPPFIRYQYLSQDAQAKAETIFKLLHLPFTKHTNAWVPFVLASISLLKPGGRLGMILPAEIIHVAHPQALRTFLGHTCSRLLIIDPEEIWFENTLQGAVILLAEKKQTSTDHGYGLGIVKVSGKSFLSANPSDLFNDTARLNGKTVEGKWTRALLTKSERQLIDELTAHPEVHRFGKIADVDVGLVTGANKFFLVNDETVKQYGLRKYAHPMFGRSEHCPGVIYDERQHTENARIGNPTNFIWLNHGESELSGKVRDYIQLGTEENLHTRYKCRIRNPWYVVPSVYSTEIGMLKRAHDTPRLIHNKLGAYTTDTAYRVTTTACKPQKMVYCFLNALTALSAELEGRYYGGGVLELVPSEIEKLLVPLPQSVRPELRTLDKAVRTMSAAEILEQQNRQVLGAVGLSKGGQEQLLAAWLRLKNRRQRISDAQD